MEHTTAEKPWRPLLSPSFHSWLQETNRGCVTTLGIWSRNLKKNKNKRGGWLTPHGRLFRCLFWAVTSVLKMEVENVVSHHLGNTRVSWWARQICLCWHRWHGPSRLRSPGGPHRNPWTSSLCSGGIRPILQRRRTAVTCERGKNGGAGAGN